MAPLFSIYINALDNKTGSYRHFVERADKGLLVAKTLDECQEDGIAVLLVLIGDVINGASDFLHPVRQIGIHPIDGFASA